MEILVVAAHPDDETLGCGGTIARHAHEGDEVFVCIVTEGTASLGFSKEEDTKRKNEAERACKILGVKKVFFINLPSVKLDTLPFLEIVNHLQNLMNKIKPVIVYTHYPKDQNQDHRIVSHACLIATQPQRAPFLKKLYYYEVPSSTTYVCGEDAFCPTTYIDIEKFFELKLKALSCYASEIKAHPHPRSIEGINTYTQFRGLAIHTKHAEAFIVAREIR